MATFRDEKNILLDKIKLLNGYTFKYIYFLILMNLIF